MKELSLSSFHFESIRSALGENRFCYAGNPSDGGRRNSVTDDPGGGRLPRCFRNAARPNCMFEFERETTTLGADGYGQQPPRPASNKEWMTNISFSRLLPAGRR